MTHEFAELPVLSINLPAWVTRVTGSSGIYTTLEAQMRLAITLARENVLHSSGGPFGAAVFEQGSGRLVSVGVNSVERLHNAILHAEVMAPHVCPSARTVVYPAYRRAAVLYPRDLV